MQAATKRKSEQVSEACNTLGLLGTIHDFGYLQYQQTLVQVLW